MTSGFNIMRLDYRGRQILRRLRAPRRRTSVDDDSPAGRDRHATPTAVEEAKTRDGLISMQERSPFLFYPRALRYHAGVASARHFQHSQCHADVAACQKEAYFIRKMPAPRLMLDALMPRNALPLIYFTRRLGERYKLPLCL